MPELHRLPPVSSGLLRNRSSRATFVCYHSVAADGPRYLTISQDLFEEHLTVYRKRGLHSGDLSSLAAAAEGRAIEPTIFLTFDDGFRNNYETVLPLLREYERTAFVFVLPPLVDGGAPLDWPEVAGYRHLYGPSMRSLTWPMLEEMKEAGMEVGSHGLSHAHLPELGREQLREELWESRRRIKERLGSCETLAYPFGEWGEKVATAAAECGYRFAFSLPTKSGQRNATPLSIPRVNLDYRDSGLRLASKLSPMGRRIYLSENVADARRCVRGKGRSRRIQTNQGPPPENE